MSDNSDLVRTAITRVFVEGDVSAIDEFWSDDYKQHNPQIPDGREHLAGFLSSLPENAKYELGPVVSEGDLVMVQGRLTGLAEKPLVVVDIFRIRDGKLDEHWDVMQEEVPAEQAASGRPMFPAG